MIREVCAEKDWHSYVIGGYVRDRLLGLDTKDIDIVVVGSGIELAKLVGKKLGGVNVSYFKNFGTAMLRWNDIEVEFVGARKESYRRGSRKPIVEEGSIEDDQRRRDFTINALAIALHTAQWGELIDPFDGLADLEFGVIRTPLNPEITYSDDPLRMLRAIRFSNRFGYMIDDESFAAIKSTAERIKIVSFERISDELNKIMLAPKPGAAFVQLDDSGLLDYIFPELSAMKGVDLVRGLGTNDRFTQFAHYLVF